MTAFNRTTDGGEGDRLDQARADAGEAATIRRYRRLAGFGAAVAEASRRADARLRLELALRGSMPLHGSR